MLDPDTFTSPESDEVARLRARRSGRGVDHVIDNASAAAARACARAAAGPSRRGRSRHGLLPLQQRGRRRAAAARAGSSASRSWTTTCTTATARSGSSTRIRAVLFVSSHQYPFYPGTGAVRGRGKATGAASRSTCRSRAGRPTPTTDGRLPRRSCPSCAVRAGARAVSAGFDAHERDPLARMRMTHRASATLTARLPPPTTAMAASSS